MPVYHCAHRGIAIMKTNLNVPLKYRTGKQRGGAERKYHSDRDGISFFKYIRHQQISSIGYRYQIELTNLKISGIRN